MLTKRLLAFLLDYLIVLAYIAVLTGVSLLFFNVPGNSPSALHPFRGQLLGLITLTIPVFLYFYISERRNGMTVGKRKFHIKVVRKCRGKWSMLIRNTLKILIPWEIAHAGVHWIYFDINREAESPVWVFALLILPQIIVLIYLISIVLSKGSGSLYDRLAGTEVVQD